MKLINLVTKLVASVIVGNIILAMCSENTNTNHLANQNTSTEKANLNSEIFLREKVFKYKNVKKAAALNSNTSKNTERKKSTSKTNTNLKETEVDGPVLHQTWVKYFKYADGAINAPLPKGFEINPEFDEQKKYHRDEDYKQKNLDGTFDLIRDKNYFYLHLFENVVTIISSRENRTRKLVDTFTIPEIANIFEDSKENKRNGVLDYGKFNEGYCLKIATKDQTNQVFIICTETESEKDQLISKIKALKIREQHDKGLILLAKSKVLKQGDTLESLLGKKSNTEPSKPLKKNQNPVDGYWVTLQDWSQCNKKCEGGISTFHRMCVPAKLGGKPCEGEAIITKKCNMNPCPMVEGGNNGSNPLENKDENTTVMDPIVKIMPFTDAPQRYTLCKIKESDLLIYEDGLDPNKMDDPLFKGKKIDDIGGMKLPCRAVMNTQTLTVYAGQKFETIYMSFTLKKTRFYEAKNKKNCFKLYETSKKYITLCPYGAEISSKEHNEWERDFEIFKTRCDRPKKGILSEAEQKALDNKIKDKMDEAKKQALDEAHTQERMKKAIQGQGDLAVLVKNTHNVAMKAIQKEQTLEDLIKQEAEEKNRMEEERMWKLIEAEKHKKDCVLKAIKEKELENQIQEKAKEIQQTISAIKQEAAAQVLMKRNNLKKVLNQINQKAALKRNQMRQELLNVRLSIANEIGRAYKKGDINKCVDAMTSVNKRINYCVSSFAEDFTNMNYCKNTEEFCELCCGTEFGEMLSNDKDKCIQQVCPKKEGGATGKNDGTWVAQQTGGWEYEKSISK